MASAVTASIDLSALQEGSVQMVKRLYGLNPSDFDGCLLYYPQTNMEAEELLLLKLRDTSQQEAVRAAVRPGSKRRRPASTATAWSSMTC